MKAYGNRVIFSDFTDFEHNMYVTSFSQVCLGREFTKFSWMYWMSILVFGFKAPCMKTILIIYLQNKAKPDTGLVYHLRKAHGDKKIIFVCLVFCLVSFLLFLMNYTIFFTPLPFLPPPFYPCSRSPCS